MNHLLLALRSSNNTTSFNSMKFNSEISNENAMKRSSEYNENNLVPDEYDGYVPNDELKIPLAALRAPTKMTETGTSCSDNERAPSPHRNLFTPVPPNTLSSPRPLFTPIPPEPTSSPRNFSPVPPDVSSQQSLSPVPPDSNLTPRSRKRWNKRWNKYVSNNLFLNCGNDNSSSSESSSPENDVETSIDGIYIEFDNDVPKIVDRKRCSHISALAHVTCVHHGAPKFVKRHRTLKSHSLDKFKHENEQHGSQKRPLSADSPKKRTISAENPKKKHLSSDSTKRRSMKDTRTKHQNTLIEPLDLCLTRVKGTKVPKLVQYSSNEDKENVDNVITRRVSDPCLEEGKYHELVRANPEPSNTALRNIHNNVPEDLYKAVQQKTPSDHVFVEYGKETRRVAVAGLPVSLNALLDRIIAAFCDTLTLDMVPLKALYIEDPQSKIFYQLDDPNDVVKGSHLKLNEEFVMLTIDRGSSQSLEDLNNSSNSSLSSGGYVIPATINNMNHDSQDTKPVIRRHGKSRLSLVEERLSLITHGFNTIALKSDAGSTHSAVSSQTDFGGPKRPPDLLHIIRTLKQNLAETRAELMVLRKKELERKAEVDELVKMTTQQITEHVESCMPQGIRRKRVMADKVEDDYRQLAEITYTNIKDLEVTVDVLKTDVVKRKVRLDPLQLESMERELKQYTSQIHRMNSTFTDLKESLKDVMAEELEIIVNEEQFLQDEEPMLEEGTIKCEDLAKLMDTLKKVAVMQQNKGTKHVEIYTASEHDIMDERNNVITAISALVPNHEERVQSIQATEEFRAAQRKFVKSESEQVTEEIQLKSQNLRKTNKFEELERRREEALRNMFNAYPAPHKFGGKSLESEIGAPFRRSSLNKCKSMSSIAHNNDHDMYAQSEEYDSETQSSEQPSRSSSIKRSRSFSTKEKNNSEDEKTKKRTMFAGFFTKKSKSKQESETKSKQELVTKSKQEPEFLNKRDLVESDSTSDVVVIDTAKSKKNSGDKYVHYEDNGSLSPVVHRSNTLDPSMKRNNKSKNKNTVRQSSLPVQELQKNDIKSRNKKSKNR